MTVTRAKQRQKANKDIRGTNNIDDLEHNNEAGARKTIKTMGHLIVLGAVPTASVLDLQDSGKTISLWNSDTATHYVKIGDSSITAPAGAADGIALPGGQYTTITLTSETCIRADAASKVFAYEVEDSSYWA